MVALRPMDPGRCPRDTAVNSAEHTAVRRGQAAGAGHRAARLPGEISKYGAIYGATTAVYTAQKVLPGLGYGAYGGIFLIVQIKKGRRREEGEKYTRIGKYRRKRRAAPATSCGEAR